MSRDQELERLMREMQRQATGYSGRGEAERPLRMGEPGFRQDPSAWHPRMEGHYRRPYRFAAERSGRKPPNVGATAHLDAERGSNRIQGPFDPRRLIREEQQQQQGVADTLDYERMMQQAFVRFLMSGAQ